MNRAVMTSDRLLANYRVTNPGESFRRTRLAAAMSVRRKPVLSGCTRNRRWT